MSWGNLTEWNISSCRNQFSQSKSMKVMSALGKDTAGVFSILIGKLDDGTPYFFSLGLSFFRVKHTKKCYGLSFRRLAGRFLPTNARRIGILNVVDSVLLEGEKCVDTVGSQLTVRLEQEEKKK